MTFGIQVTKRQQQWLSLTDAKYTRTGITKKKKKKENNNNKRAIFLLHWIETKKSPKSLIFKASAARFKLVLVFISYFEGNKTKQKRKYGFVNFIFCFRIFIFKSKLWWFLYVFNLLRGSFPFWWFIYIHTFKRTQFYLNKYFYWKTC